MENSWRLYLQICLQHFASLTWKPNVLTQDVLTCNRLKQYAIYVQTIHVKHIEVLHVLGDRVRDPLLARVGEGRSGVAARDSEERAVVGVADSSTGGRGFPGQAGQT